MYGRIKRKVYRFPPTSSIRIYLLFVYFSLWLKFFLKHLCAPFIVREFFLQSLLIVHSETSRAPSQGLENQKMFGRETETLFPCERTEQTDSDRRPLLLYVREKSRYLNFENAYSMGETHSYDTLKNMTSSKCHKTTQNHFYLIISFTQKHLK